MIPYTISFYYRGFLNNPLHRVTDFYRCQFLQHWTVRNPERELEERENAKRVTLLTKDKVQLGGEGGEMIANFQRNVVTWGVGVGMNDYAGKMYTWLERGNRY